MEGHNDPIELYRSQGKAIQLRVLQALPVEIQTILDEFAERDRRNAEIAKEQEKVKHEHR